MDSRIKGLKFINNKEKEGKNKNKQMKNYNKDKSNKN